MADTGPTYRIDPIEPGHIGPRFAALVARLEPVLEASDLATLRSEVERGDYATAFARLDALTDIVTNEIETAALIEVVLLGQAIRPDRSVTGQHDGSDAPKDDRGHT